MVQQGGLLSDEQASAEYTKKLVAWRMKTDKQKNVCLGRMGEVKYERQSETTTTTTTTKHTSCMSTE